jgi:amino acid adenylation domain-containing protein
VGETKLYALSTPAFAYREFDVPSLDLNCLEAALDHLVRRHDMMRVRVTPNGRQVCTPPGWSAKRVGYADLRTLAPHEVEARLEAKRQSVGRDLPALEAGAPFYCFVHQLPGSYRVHLAFRLFAVDAESIGILLRDLLHAYHGRSLGSAIRTFREYVNGLVAYRSSADYKRSIAYWKKRALTLLPPPDLPLLSAALPAESRFAQRRYHLLPALWQAFRAKAARHRISFNVALCAVYADVLALWSGGKPFSLTTMVARRPEGDPNWHDVVGNFASTTLLQVDAHGCPRFVDRAQRLQSSLHRDLEHTAVSAVEVLRMRRQLLQESRQQAVPVVFASSLGLPPLEAGVMRMNWKPVAQRLHTPQIWIDHQVYEDGSGLVCNWDFVEEMFPKGMIDEMFATYCRNLVKLSEDESAWCMTAPWRLPDDQLRSRRAANATREDLPKGLLHEPFLAAAGRRGNHPALISPDRTLGYAETDRLTRNAAAKLRDLHISPGDLVGVCAQRSWQQIVATISIVRAGAAYVPLDPDLPAERLRLLLERSGACCVLVGDGCANSAFDPQVRTYAIESLFADPGKSELGSSATKPDDLAYVIYTSGSTGLPKGVAIAHRAAVNTIQDVLQRFGFGAKDRLLALSSLSFDLSVFDVFGSLGCGAALVIPPYSPSPDPAAWATCIEEQAVTVWNSVPQLLGMMIDYLGDRAPAVIGRLRLVMLSGDWIPLSLVRHLRAMNPSLLIVGLGGATEAAIWSNYCVVDDVMPHWTSVPYGMPLANQRYHILDSALRDSPTWVANELYIAGDGLAAGYHNDPERTVASFVVHPSTGERLYRTGDYGRYWPDGTIEFLGRRDTQVKIGGFRIELGEIEACLLSHPAVRQATCIVDGSSDADRRLLAFLVAKQDDTIVPEAIRAHLARRLPSYMVPRAFVVLDELPLTANGKVDRQRLRQKAQPLLAADKDVDVACAARDELEKELAELWGRLCNRPVPAVEMDFFAAGGTSLLAVRLLGCIRDRFGVTLPLASLFEHGTIRAQADLIRQQRPKSCAAPMKAAARRAVVHIRSGSVPLVLIHPVGGNVLCYRTLAELMPPAVGVAGVQMVARDGLEANTIPEMAAIYAGEILEAFPNQMVHLGGWSMGGIIALEVARHAAAAGSPVCSLTLIDSYRREADAPTCGGYAGVRGFFSDYLAGAGLPQAFSLVERLRPEAQFSAGLHQLQDLGLLSEHLDEAQLASAFAIYVRNYRALLAYEPTPPTCRTLIVGATQQGVFRGLTPFASTDMRVRHVVVAADHYSIMCGAGAAAVSHHVARHILTEGSRAERE